MKVIRTLGQVALIGAATFAFGVSTLRAQTSDMDGTTDRGTSDTRGDVDTGAIGGDTGTRSPGAPRTGEMGTSGTTTDPVGTGVTGTIDTFNSETGMLGLRTPDGRTHTYRVGNQTSVMQGEEIADVNDLSTGDTVTVYPLSNGTGTGSKIELRRIEIQE